VTNCWISRRIKWQKIEDVSEEGSASIISVNLIMEALRSFEMSVLTGVRRRHTPEDGMFHDRSENLVHLSNFFPSGGKQSDNLQRRKATPSTRSSLCFLLASFRHRHCVPPKLRKASAKGKNRKELNV
jgi:hypothetical protein